MSTERSVVLSPAPCGRAPSRVPTWRTIARTLDISIRVLWASLRGRYDLGVSQRLLDGWSRDIFRYASARLEATGLDHLEPGGCYVVMSNHGSLIDIPAVIATFPGRLRMVTKEELLAVPIWGRALVVSGFIPVNRKDRARAIEQLELAKERLAQGVAVWLAPEGTRSRSGVLGPFKKGGFHLARQLGAQIVPAWIEGAAELLPPDTFMARYDASVTVHYGRPIDMPQSEDLDRQVARVRSAIEALRDDSRAVQGGARRSRGC